MSLDSLAPYLSGLGGPELAAALGGLAVLVAVGGLYLIAVPHAVEDRLRLFVNPYRRTVASTRAAAGVGTPTVVDVLERQLTRRRASAGVRMLLLRADIQLTLSEFLALRLFAAAAVGALVALFLVPRLGLVALAFAAVAALVGSYLPLIVVQARARRRLAALEGQLPDALDLVAASLQSGSGLGQAFELLSREMSPPISVEFRRVTQEIGLGLSTTEALANLAHRVDSEDVDLVVTTIDIQSRVGGNLVHVFRTITDSIRERVRIRGEIKTLTSQQRLSAIVISIIPPALAVLMFILNPKYASGLLAPGLMRFFLVAGVVMMIAGILALRKITDVEV